MASLLKDKTLYMHLLAIGLFLILLFWLFFKYLDLYTHHGESVTVPDFSGLKLDDLDAYCRSHKLQYSIIDSIYDINKERGTVAEQIPPPESQVKEGRKIYLTVVSKQKEMKRVPNLVDATLRQAISILETYGLKVGRLSYRPAECVKCVLDMTFRGHSIKPGTMVERGSKIDLVLGRGKSGEMVPVPILLHLTLEEVYTLLKSKALDVGAIVDCEGCATRSDTASARVYKQSPPFHRDRLINLGSSIDIYLTTDSSRLRPFESDTLTEAIDSTQFNKDNADEVQ